MELECVTRSGYEIGFVIFVLCIGVSVACILIAKAIEICDKSFKNNRING